LEEKLAQILIETINAETAAYSEVLKVAEGKTRLIIDSKSDELEELVKTEQAYSQKLEKLDARRSAAAERLAQQFKAEPKGITVSKLVSLLRSPLSETLNASAKSLMATVAKLKDVNALNQKLIKNSLEYIEFSLNIMTATSVAGNMYGNSGQAEGVRKNNIFDMKF